VTAPSFSDLHLGLTGRRLKKAMKPERREDCSSGVRSGAIIRDWLVRSAALALLLLLAAAPPAAAQSLTPLVLGWEQFFKLTWDASEDRGQPVVRGYIKNDAGFAANKVRLLVEAVDASGRVTGQRVSWLGSALTPGMRAYFEAPAPPRAAAYRVSVFAYDWLQTASVEAP
jgi:hypothetical protein